MTDTLHSQQVPVAPVAPAPTVHTDASAAQEHEGHIDLELVEMLDSLGAAQDTCRMPDRTSRRHERTPTAGTTDPTSTVGRGAEMRRVRVRTTGSNGVTR